MAFNRKRRSTSSFRPRSMRALQRRRFTGGFRASSSRRRRRVSAVSAQLGNVKSIGFRSRRMSRSAWRRALWRDTLFKQHWRSLESGSQTLNAPASIDDAELGYLPALNASFWTAGGGTVASDVGGTVPLFTGDIVLRGGISKIQFSNNAVSDSIRVKLYMVWANTSPTVAGVLPAGGSIVDAAWDPSLLADFARFGKVIGQREFIIVPGQRPTEVSYRYKPRKVDQVVFNNLGEQLFWMWTINQMSNVDGGTQAVTVQRSHNVSFSGDAIGTT